MYMNDLRIKLLHQNAKPPTRQTYGSVGYDISACIDEPLVIKPNERVKIPTGFAIALPQGYAAFIYARSGLSFKHGLIPANGVGVIDSDYRGEVGVCLLNLSDKSFTVNPGDRVAQMVITRCELPELIEVEELGQTERGTNGFGSTGTT
ncbi:MAG: dUTP diphosphatase [Oscillospiraceae bacterium]|jgi:dUTP pyrophosphatase|nr:dUTP diphosphatase [Oscillospiraceae bacterium]